jgi:cytochrome c oxidase assembly protein subunit 15
VIQLTMWLHRFALLTAASTFGLIYAGALVTSTGSGLAVPDWPLSFGQFFPPMVGGVFYEHGHRMVAATVGCLTAVLAVWLWRADGRAWVRRLGLLAAGVVVLQGVLGGMTVLMGLPPAVSVAHACLAQGFLCLVVVLALSTGPGWGIGTVAVRRPDDARVPLRWIATGFAAVVYGQLVIGAIMRHTGAGLAIPDFPLAYGRIVPPIASQAVAIHFAHRVGAVLVLTMAGWTCLRVVRRHAAERRLLRPALVALWLGVLQVALGALIIWTRRAVVPTSAHVLIGAAILAAGVVLAVRAHRLLQVPVRAGRPLAVSTQVVA